MNHSHEEDGNSSVLGDPGKVKTNYQRSSENNEFNLSISESCFDSATATDSSIDVEHTPAKGLDEPGMNTTLTSTPLNTNTMATIKRKKLTDSSASSDQTETNREGRRVDLKKKPRQPSPAADEQSEEEDESSID
jgi:hypothetical protein